MPDSPWNSEEIAKLRRRLELSEQEGDAGPLKVQVESISAAEFRSKAGQLRGGSTVVVVTYRNAPAALAVPHPIDAWQDAKTFISRLVAYRNLYLVPPYRDPTHPWAEGLTQIKTGTMETIRRQTASVFAHVLRNVVFLMTYYDQYEVMSLIPIPPDTPEEIIQGIARPIAALVQLPLTADVLDVGEPDTRLPSLPGIDEEDLG
jgi:hypothetical protein